MVETQNSVGKRLGHQFKRNGTPTRFTKARGSDGNMYLRLIRTKNILDDDVRELEAEAKKRGLLVDPGIKYIQYSHRARKATTPKILRVKMDPLKGSGAVGIPFLPIELL